MLKCSGGGVRRTRLIQVLLQVPAQELKKRGLGGSSNANSTAGRKRTLGDLTRPAAELGRVPFIP